MNNGILNDNDSYVLMNSINHYQLLQHQEALNYWISKNDLILVKTFNLKPFKDGNQWCVLLGNNIQEGIVGFGDTPLKAITNFNSSFNQTKNI